jgi:undecaprenyl phosphate-alpha-L-ara4N flippase subunit ArnE
MKVWLLLGTVIGATVISDLLQSFEMKRAGEVQAASSFIASVFQKKLLILSVLAMAVSFFAFMMLVQVAQLSFAVPFTAASVVFETILAKFVLKEQIGPRRWIGVACVALGVYLLAA